MNCENIMQNEETIEKYLKENPRQLLLQPSINSNLLKKVLDSGYIPTKEDYQKNPNLKDYFFSLVASFHVDPSIITLFPSNLTNEKNATFALNNGYMPTLSDLKENPELVQCSAIMENLIYQNPKNIVYIGNRCELSDACIDFVKANYTLTRQDFYQHMNLCFHSSLLEKLGKEYRLFDFLLSDLEKISIVKEYLLEEKWDEILNLPFFDVRFGAPLSSDCYLHFLKLLWLPIQEEDVLKQKEYAQILDKIIDGIAILRYQKNKENFEYSSIDSIHHAMFLTFLECRKNGDMSLLRQFILDIYEFVNIKTETEMSYSYIHDEVFTLYDIFLKNNFLSKEVTTPFYNEILNQHRNSFYKIEKRKIIDSLKQTLPLTKKKKTHLINDYLLKKITEYMKEKEYAKFSSSLEEIQRLCLLARKEIYTSKEARRSLLPLNDGLLEELETIFLENGCLNISDVAFVLQNDDALLHRLIGNKYNRIKMQFLSRIELDSDFTLDTSLISFHYNNFVMADKNHFCEVMATCLVGLNRDIYQKIVENEALLPDIKQILPFVSLFSEFNQSTLWQILTNHKKVKEKLEKNMHSSTSLSLLLYNFQDFIYLSQGYASCSNLVKSIFKPETLHVLKEYNGKSYLRFYLSMFLRYEGSIPPLSGTFGNISYISGNYSDEERLLIGKNIKYSCIDLFNSAGKSTFLECLTEPTGDVILFYDAKTKEFLGRMLLFRRGNIVQMAKVYTTKGTLMHLPIAFYQTVAQKIIKEAEKVNDNIDYVFMTAIDALENSIFPKFCTSKFEYRFPHAEFSFQAYLVGAKTYDLTEENLNEKLDFHASASSLYLKKRYPVRNDASDFELTRIRALRVATLQDDALKHLWTEKFEPFYRKEYEMVLSGENWYIARKWDGTLESVFIPLKDVRAKEEFEEAKKIFSKEKTYSKKPTSL